MRQEGILKHFAAALVIAVVFYFAGFNWLQHRRVEKGPWQVTFQTDAAGTPAISIVQSNLNIFKTISFPRGRAAPGLSRTLAFGQETPDLPFGEMIYQDPTFLPGTVTMRLFGHEIELLPRVLTIDKKEYTWRSGGVAVP